MKYVTVACSGCLALLLIAFLVVVANSPRKPVTADQSKASAITYADAVSALCPDAQIPKGAEMMTVRGYLGEPLIHYRLANGNDVYRYKLSDTSAIVVFNSNDTVDHMERIKD